MNRSNIEAAKELIKRELAAGKTPDQCSGEAMFNVLEKEYALTHSQILTVVQELEQEAVQNLPQNIQIAVRILQTKQDIQFGMKVAMDLAFFYVKYASVLEELEKSTYDTTKSNPNFAIIAKVFKILKPISAELYTLFDEHSV